MQLTYLIKGLAAGPAIVERLVALVPESRYDEKTDPGRFSFREAMAHLAEWDLINLDRLRRGVQEPGCTVQGFDESQKAIDGNYQATDPVEQARLFAERRKDVVAFVKSLTPEDWTKIYYHSERGEQTVHDQAVNILGHDTYHIEHFTQYLQ